MREYFLAWIVVTTLEPFTKKKCENSSAFPSALKKAT
jgi:hypothetical protein